jgi:hypothetical protein
LGDLKRGGLMRVPNQTITANPTNPPTILITMCIDASSEREFSVRKYRQDREIANLFLQKKLDLIWRSRLNDVKIFLNITFTNALLPADVT